MAVSITDADLVRMRANLLYDGPNRRTMLSRFWTLLILAAVIASAGVVADSTATVIGAMIVAPLMVPILGTVLSIVTTDRINLVRSVALVTGGALAAVAVGWLVGVIDPIDVVAANNTQVAGRVSPSLIDLLAALATGVVGAFAQCREDVSDTLPGVAIAISLVPPLTVVGLTLEAGAFDQSVGALLLFSTNVAAILLSGCVVMALYGVFGHAVTGGTPTFNRRAAVSAVVFIAIVIAIPLTISTVTTISARLEEGRVHAVAEAWADPVGWSVLELNRDPENKELMVLTMIGPPPIPDVDELRRQMVGSGHGDVDIRIRLVDEDEVLFGQP